jgi:DNA gyrase subunit B
MTQENLTAIISIKHPDPFESQTKVKLMNPEVQTMAQQIIGDIAAFWRKTLPLENRSCRNVLLRRGERCSQKARPGHPEICFREFHLARQAGRLCRNETPRRLNCILWRQIGWRFCKTRTHRHFQAILPLRENPEH